MTRALRRTIRLPLIAAHLLAAAGLVIAVYPLVTPAQREVIARGWMRGLCRLLGVRRIVHGPLPATGGLITSNHISWLDIPVVLATVPGTFISKGEVAHWPLIGWLARRGGTLFVQRGQGEATLAVANTMTHHLADGRTLVLFPEGTTTVGGAPRHFYPRLFQAPIRAARPVWPLALHYPHPQGDGCHPRVPYVGDDQFLPHGWRLLGEAGITVHLHFTAPLEAAGQPRRKLADAAHAAVSAQLIPTAHNSNLSLESAA